MHAADFQRLVGEQLARIHRVALAWCRDPIAREDLVQEILLQLCRLAAGPGLQLPWQL